MRPAPLALSPSKHTVPKHSTIIRSILGSQKTMKPTPNLHLNDKRTNIYQNVSWKGRNRREWDSHSVSYFSLLYDVSIKWCSINLFLCKVFTEIPLTWHCKMLCLLFTYQACPSSRQETKNVCKVVWRGTDFSTPTTLFGFYVHLPWGFILKRSHFGDNQVSKW